MGERGGGAREATSPAKEEEGKGRIMNERIGRGGGRAEVVSLSTHADGYLNRLINDAYVDRLCCRSAGYAAASVIRFLGNWRLRQASRWSFDQPVYLPGPVRVTLVACLKTLYAVV